MPKKMGRPKIEISQSIFEGLCHIQCTKEEIAATLRCDEDTINTWCKETYKQTFSVVFDQKRKGGWSSLRRKQWEVALSGDKTMLIWLGKQYLGQSDKQLVAETTKEELTDNSEKVMDELKELFELKKLRKST